MKHHDDKNINLFYLVGLLTGLFIGVVINIGISWIIGLGITGLLFAGFFVSAFVKTREDA